MVQGWAMGVQGVRCVLVWILCAVITIAAASVESDIVKIDIDGHDYEYSMSVTPPDDSPVVEREKEELLGVLDLESFVRDLGRFGKYIRVAYNGIGAVGPRFQDLQTEVQKLGFDISKLCDKSAVTIAKFKTTTRTVLFELKAAYQFLIKGRERMALDSFSELAELAEKMEKAAESLKLEFERQEAKVTDVLEKTQQRGAAEHIRMSDIRAQQEKTELNVKIQEDLAKEHGRLEEEFRAERKKYERKEDKAMSSKSSFLSRLGNVITSSFGLGKLFDDGSDAEQKASRWRQKSIEKLENEKEQRKLKQAALRLMAELVHDLKSLEGEKELADIAVKALHKASGSLKQLIVLLKQAALFWNQLKEHCRDLADDKLQRKIETFVASYSEEERMEYWNSDGFKQRMFMYISRWVALHSVSSTYLQQIKLTQEDLYDYILENPTYEESRQNLQQLVSEFEDDLHSEYARIAAKDSQADEKIQKLKADQEKEKNVRKTEL